MKHFVIYLVIILIFETIIFFYGYNWLSNMLPDGDFPGTVTVVAELKTRIASWDYSNWSEMRFCGSPNVFLWSSFYALAYVPFSFFFEPVIAIKIGALFYLGLAGAMTFGVCYCLTRRTLISFWAGLAYMINPIFMFSITHAGHMNFPPYYVIGPIVFLALWKLNFRPSPNRLVLASLTVLAAALIDTERAVSSLPFVVAMILLFGFLNSSHLDWKQRIQTAWRSLRWLVTSFVSAFLAGAFIFIPLIIEKHNFAFFTPDALANCRKIFGLNNIFYLFDRNGWIVRQFAGYLPDQFCFDAGNFYLGISIIALVSLICFVKQRSFVTHFVHASILICLLMICAASGIHSLYSNFAAQTKILYQHLRYCEEHPYLLPAVAIIILLWILAAVILRKILRMPPLTVGWLFFNTGLLIFIIYIPIFAGLVKISLFSQMRNAGFFVSVLPPFLLVLSSSFILKHLLEDFKTMAYLAIISVILIITLLDFYSYRAGFDRQIPPVLYSEFKNASDLMASSTLEGRFLSRESYSPFSDMHNLYAKRQAAWYWLNWSCPRDTHTIVREQIYSGLSDSNSIEHSLQIASLFNIRFITYNLLDGPPPPKNTVLNEVFKGQTYALYQNELCRNFIQVYKAKSENGCYNKLEELVSQKPLDYPVKMLKHASDLIRFEFEPSQKCLVLLSQSSFPGWSVKIDGIRATMQTIEGVFPGTIVMPGPHQITFYYDRPWYYYCSFAVTILTFISMLIVYFRQNKRYDQN